MAHSDESLQSQDNDQSKVPCSGAEGGTNDKSAISNKVVEAEDKGESHSQARIRLRRKYCAYFGKSNRFISRL